MAALNRFYCTGKKIFTVLGSNFNYLDLQYFTCNYAKAKKKNNKCVPSNRSENLGRVAHIFFSEKKL